MQLRVAGSTVNIHMKCKLLIIVILLQFLSVVALIKSAHEEIKEKMSRYLMGKVCLAISCLLFLRSFNLSNYDYHQFIIFTTKIIIIIIFSYTLSFATSLGTEDLTDKSLKFMEWLECFKTM